MCTSRPWWASSLLLVPALWGCPSKETPAPEDTVDPTPPVTLGSFHAPVAGWDPLWFELSDGDIAAPVVYDADGAEVALTPLQVEDGAPYGWVAAPPFAPGVYDVAGTDTLDVAEPLAFEVGAWGVDPAFDPQSVVGTSWELSTPPVVPVPAGIGSVIVGYLGESYLRVDAVSGEEVAFRVYTQVAGSTEVCQVLHATGRLSSTGELTWSTPAIDADTEPAPLHVSDVSLHLGWRGDGGAAAGAEGAAVIDTRALDPYVDPDQAGGTCGLLASFGGACLPCESDGAAFCAPVRFYAGQLTPTDPIPDDVALCGVDLAEAGKGLSCDFDPSGYSCAGVLLPFGGLAVLRRRRRTAR